MEVQFAATDGGDPVLYEIYCSVSTRHEGQITPPATFPITIASLACTNFDRRRILV